MPFMVIYSTSDGSSCHEQADAIDEAALFVERLRNKEGIEEIRIYRMEEISFAFRPYYKVELGMPDKQATAPPAEVVGAAPSPSAPEAAPVVVPPAGDAPSAPPAPADATTEPPTSMAHADGDGANGRRGLFGR
jgi:hypothetical protein